MKQLRSWRKYYKETNIIKSTAKNKPKEEKQDKEIERKLDKVHNSNTEMLEILKKNEFSEIVKNIFYKFYLFLFFFYL